jgi:hypothetical protein
MSITDLTSEMDEPGRELVAQVTKADLDFI